MSLLFPLHSVFPVSLHLTFPQFPWARKADKWLNLIENTSIKQQLSKRKIKKIRIWYTFDNPMAYTRIKEFGILVVLDRDQPQEFFFSLGHEIGHTFHLNLRRNPIVNIGPEKVFRNRFETLTEDEEIPCNAVEDFCDQFAVRWMYINGRENFRLFFENNKNTDLLSARSDIF